jgi:hypothetical protein
MYDRADKVLEIDRHSVMAIAGSPAIAWEMARILEHAFQFFRRSQLQEMSVEGKVLPKRARPDLWGAALNNLRALPGNQNPYRPPGRRNS